MTAPALRILRAALLAAAICGGAPSAAFCAKAPHSEAKEADRIRSIETALSEQRYVDAGQMIDQSLLSGTKNPMFMVLGGELNLARGRYEPALDAFKKADEFPETRARAQQGMGLTLSLLGRSDDALSMLKQAVAAEPSAWRAWNALGGEYDRRRDWTNADAAYASAMEASNGAAIVLNNRGFSRLLQNRLEDAVRDLVAALEKRPDLSAARTNLRLTMGLKGEYDRALASGPQEDRAALLNNVGYAALLRGDQAQAETMFNEAIAARGQFYGRAANNLETSNGLNAIAQAQGHR